MIALVQAIICSSFVRFVNRKIPADKGQAGIQSRRPADRLALQERCSAHCQ
jgi:hypothetical protein